MLRKSRLKVSMSISLRQSCTRELSVPAWMLLHPLPCAGDDTVEIGISGLPSELPADFFRTGNEHRRIAPAARSLYCFDCIAGHSARRLKYLTDGKACSISQVVDKFVVRAEGLQSEHMRIGQVAHVDVIANAGPILRRVVRAKDRHVVTLSHCCLKDDRNQVRLRIVQLSRESVGSGGIEVAQARISKSVNSMKPRQHPLHQQL